MTLLARQLGIGYHLPPGPRGHPIWGLLPELRRNPLRLHLDAYHEYGDVVRLRAIGPGWWCFISHPDDIDHVLRRHHAIYPKDMFTQELSRLLGNGLLTSEGDFWRRQRRLAQPAFHRKRLAQLADTMVAEAAHTADHWQHQPADQPLDVADEMMRLTFQIVGRTLFSTDVHDKAEAISTALPVAMEYVITRMRYVSPPEWVPTPANRRFIHARRSIENVIDAVIAERKHDPTDRGDLLSMLMAARDEQTNTGMTDQQLRDETMTIMLAGHETTANALSWAWYLLSQHPDIAANMHDELDGVLGGRLPTLDDLPRLPYTRMVLDETLRLYPPAWSIGRQAAEDDELRGYDLPKGTPVIMVQYVTHRRPDLWDEPERFDPERFSPQRSAGRPPMAYFPFGGGPRLCIGNNFALMEGHLVLATLASRYRLSLVPGHPVEMEPLITLRPRHGMRMFVERRGEG